MIPRPVLVNAALAIAVVTACGTVGYMLIANMAPIEALYMTIITLTTVGYHEVRPLGTGGRIFTMALLTGGLGIVVYSINAIARDFIEGEFRHKLGRRRMEQSIAELRDHFIVCGHGRMGVSLCAELAARPVPFIVVDSDPDACRSAESLDRLCIEGDATHDGVLQHAGIERARGLFTTLPKDAENVYVVLTARELNPRLSIIARAESERSEKRLRSAGATQAISPYDIAGSRMANAVLRPAVLDVFDLATKYRTMELQIEEVGVPARGYPCGLTLAESRLREQLGMLVIAIKKPGGEMIFAPAASVRTEEGDRLVVMGEPNNLRALEARLGSDGLPQR